ncbi:MAG: hypothetical protein FJ138_15620 [Deltaproteobacteria bacterium]|nr:hypothetical protein [Deltaproteobacteria bacterium]
MLFASYEVTEGLLRATVCLPRELMNGLLRASVDFDRPLSPELQRDVRGQLEGHFQAHNPLLVDGVRARPLLTALDLVLTAPLSETDAAPLAEGVKLHSGGEGAAILTLEVGLKSPPKQLRLIWDSPTLWARAGRRSAEQLTSKQMPGVVIYQDELTPVRFTPEEPEAVWRPAGERARPPALEALALAPPPPPSPLWAWGWLAALPLAGLAARGAGGGAGRRAGAAAAALAAAWGALAAAGRPSPLRPAALRAAVGGEVALGDEEARALFEALHHNIYRAFDYERDEQVYDALAESVAGPLLDWTFQEVAGALTLREEGGARAKVTLVRPLRWERLPLLDREREVLGALSASLTRGAFACAYRWRVVGEVTHWGHTHRRVNEHEARYVVAHTPKGWRVVRHEARGHARRPELEGAPELAR